VTLATEGLTDAILLKAMTLIPPGGVVVMEDVDVAVPKSGSDGVKRDDTPKPAPAKGKKGDKEDERHGSGGHITLSGEQSRFHGPFVANSSNAPNPCCHKVYSTPSMVSQAAKAESYS
jgi:hypothetical protein